MSRLAATAVERYHRDGFYFPVPVLTPAEALGLRRRLAPEALAHHAAVVAQSARILYRGTGVERFR